MIPSDGGLRTMEAACEGCAKVRSALAGSEPWLIAVLPSSVLLLGDHQAFEGYAVLWSRVHVEELHHLDETSYAGFMSDVRRASRAVEAATACLKLNLAILGNVTRHAHMHLFPRTRDDPHRLRHPWAHESRFGDPGADDLRWRWLRAIQKELT